MGFFDEMDLEESRTPWPSPGDDLLAEDEDWWFVACLGWTHDSWHGYVAGYWRAAGLFVEHVHNTRVDQDVLVYPFLMCWRHFAELQLKVLIGLMQQQLGQSVTLPRTHKLDLLWQATRRLLEQSDLVDDGDDLANAERVLLQLNNLDPTSQSFRYPVGTDGVETLQGLHRLHIRRFHEAMEGVAHFLDAADAGVRVLIDQRAEYEAEMRAAAGDYY